MTDVGRTIIQTVGEILSYAKLLTGRRQKLHNVTGPKPDPRILGAAPSYRPGDTLAVLCVSPLSRPPVRLRW